MNTSVRPATATAGSTALAIVAILSLLLSFFALARPAIAFHDAGNPGPEVTPTAEEFPGGEAQCPAGMAAWRFNDPAADDSQAVLLSDGSTATVTIIASNGSLTFEVENGLAAIVKVKGGVSTPGVDDQNVYDYTGSLEFPGPGIAHDDGLTTPNQQGVSHVDFCLIPLPKGSILIYKDDQTGAAVEGAVFSVTNDEDEEVGPITTDADGFACLDELPFGDYEVTETDAPDGWSPDPDTETVTVDTESTCDERLEGAEPADADATFTNTLLGSLLVLKTDGTDPLDGAVFSVTDSQDVAVNGPFTSGDDGSGLFCVDGLVFGDEYTVTETDAPDDYTMDPVNPKTHVIDSSDDCATRLAAQEIVPDLTFVNTLEQTGSITVVKEITCDICETFTPGAFFNQGENNDMSAFAQASLSGDPIEVAGMTFDSVQSVQDNAPPGSLLRHYLALQMNLRWNAQENINCDLGSLVYDGSIESLQGLTVQEISDAAMDVLNEEGADAGTGPDASDLSKDLHDAIDEINNNHGATDGVLVCDADGTSVAGFEFTLFDDEDVEVDSGETGADGTLTFSDLPLGTYTLVETGGPEGSECSVVSASGEGVTFDEETGEITIVLTENNADVTVTVVNECEQLPPPPEEELGSILLTKVDDEGATLPGATFNLYLDDGDDEFDPEDGAGNGGGGSGSCTGAANVSAVSNDGTGATAIANAVTADGTTLTAASFAAVTGGTPNGTAECLSWFATNGSTFGILTTGDVNLADDANDGGGDGVDNGGANVRGDTDYDVTVLKLDLTTPVGANCLRFDFAFYSEEFPEFVNSSYNDAFIAELNSSTWTTNGSDISAPNNFAFDPNGDVISINSTGETAMNAANADGTTYDGATVLLSAATPVGAGANSLYLSIFDQGDPILDSAVFIDNVRFQTVANVATDCVAGAQEAPAGGDELIETKATGGDGTALFSDLEAGTYWLQETDAPDGCEITQELTKVVLTEADILAGVPKAVQVENDCEQSGGQLGSITIIKDAAPNNAQDFAFTTTGTGLSSFSLDDDADAALTNQRVFTGLAAGAYTVVETATTGWTLTSITCSTGGSGNTTTRTASITLAAGQNVTCTFLNTQQGGGTLPGNPATVRQGTLANTATDLDATGSVPAVILALVMLSGLAAAGYAARAEVRRRS